jgi:uncharacterized protein
MQVNVDSTPQDWLTNVSPLLLRAEAENNLLLGLAAQAAENPERFGGGLTLLRVTDGEAVVGAALVNPYNLVLSRQPERSLRALADWLASSAVAFPGVLGPDGVPEEFVGLWGSRAGAVATLRQSQRIHECRQIAAVPIASGAARAPIEADVPTLAGWRREFHVAVNATVIDDDDAAAVRRMITNRVLLVWEDVGEIVSCAATPRRTPHGAVVAFVYTPPEHRGRGYATSCVAELTRRNLAAGAEFCCLYTDLANPVSNAIYARIGYRRMCESAWWQIESGAN